MIARVWKGATRADDADRYLDYLRRTGIAEYGVVEGHVRTITMRRIDADRAEFVLLTLWRSMEAVKAFAGDDPERAVFYPGDDRFLVARDDRVTHFEVVDQSPDPA